VCRRRSFDPTRETGVCIRRRRLTSLRGVLAEIGFAGAALARELPDGTLELIDGHLRVEMVPDSEIPVLVLDVTE
jgi:hypothetical protein